jgi:MFS transporter, PHS family, inorganic phosphate transporter
MMVAVTLMQPLGQVVAAAVGLIVLVTLGKRRGLNTLTESTEDHEAAAAIVDQIWRIVIGVGAFPAFVAIAFRLTIPESPRFTIDVSHDGKQALKANQEFWGWPIEDNYEDMDDNFEDMENPDAGGEVENVPNAGPHQPTSGCGRSEESNPFSPSELKQYFITEGNWRYLAGCSISWFCLDVAFYGLGIGNPRVIAQIWSSSRVTNTTNVPEWQNPSDPGLSIYDTLYQDSVHYIITISIGSLLGSLVLIKAIDYIPRKAVLAWSFCGLFALFAVVGGAYSTVVYTGQHALIITLYALLQLLFNLGPNTLIFLVSAII